jgi:hypothetical protein
MSAAASAAEKYEAALAEHNITIVAKNEAQAQWDAAREFRARLISTAASKKDDIAVELRALRGSLCDLEDIYDVCAAQEAAARAALERAQIEKFFAECAVHKDTWMLAIENMLVKARATDAAATAASASLSELKDSLKFLEEVRRRASHHDDAVLATTASNTTLRNLHESEQPRVGRNMMRTEEHPLRLSVEIMRHVFGAEFQPLQGSLTSHFARMYAQHLTPEMLTAAAAPLAVASVIEAAAPVAKTA